MENGEHHHHQAVIRLSPSPPPPPPPSPPLSPESAAAEALANARWTPTKEQIGVLEDLYRQGLRTPSAEQIQHLTARLREHGPVEGKNIFYWFQNHKARQRQKQKQQTFEYFAKQFHRPQPLPMLHRAPGHPFPGTAPQPPPPSQMVTPAPPSQMVTPAPPQRPACNREVMYGKQPQQQGYMATGQAAAHAAYYPQPQMQQPMHYPRMDMPRQAPAQHAPPGAVYYQHQAGTKQHPVVLDSPPATGGHTAANARRPVQPQPQTLNLFPLHPTFANREKKTRRPGTATSVVPSASASFSWESGSSESHNGESSVPFYDFFGLGSGGL